MTEQKRSAGGLDFEDLRSAVEQLDPDRLISPYADEAEMYTDNRNTLPSSPEARRGKEQIAQYLTDVCGRAMTHRIENEVFGDDRIALNEAC
jgi:hypothetical protein